MLCGPQGQHEEVHEQDHPQPAVCIRKSCKRFMSFTDRWREFNWVNDSVLVMDVATILAAERRAVGRYHVSGTSPNSHHLLGMAIVFASLGRCSI